tara:strand:+ start:436 stop:675 length:240 start_codon:yes stop_codon:yes gene_type:complete
MKKRGRPKGTTRAKGYKVAPGRPKGATRITGFRLEKNEHSPWVIAPEVKVAYRPTKGNDFMNKVSRGLDKFLTPYTHQH